jgi:hypothetical protein
MINPHDIKDKDITLTPLELINKLGVFDLDVCGILNHKTANNIISLPVDGLSETWNGRIWLNPPYSNPAPWLEKLSIHNNGIALVLNSTDTGWMHDFVFNKAYGILFLKGRPKFTRLDYSKVSIMRGVILVAYGENNFISLKNSGLDGKLIKL